MRKPASTLAFMQQCEPRILKATNAFQHSLNAFSEK